MSADEQFEMLKLGIKRQSMMILDNIGIHIKIADCPTWPLRQFISKQMYGHGRLSWFWCVKVRPWLMPKRQAEIEEAWELAGFRTKTELLELTLAKGQEMIDAQ